MSKNELFRRDYDIESEMLLDFVQQAVAGMATVTSSRLKDSGDRIEFRTSVTLTSWGDKMVAAVEPRAGDRSAVVVSGEPRVGILSTAWGEELHAATIEGQLDAALTPLVEAAKTNPIVLLQADHRRVEALFARIATTEGAKRAELVKQVLQALRTHMELEETLVYPLIQREVDKEMAEEAEVEHQLARDGLDQLEELSPDEPGFDGALAMVVAGIEHHVLEEETEAFPGLATNLSAERLAELARQLTSARAELLDPETTGAKHSTSKKAEARPARPKRATPADRAPRNRHARPKIDPDETTKADLVDQAKKAGVGGYSHMTKAELARALTRA
jgi:hemerythrin-like domain-containing protein